MTSEWADISVGMHEGAPGWNTLLVRTAAGRILVERAVASGMLVVEAMPAASLSTSRRLPRRRSAGPSKPSRKEDW